MRVSNSGFGQGLGGGLEQGGLARAQPHPQPTILPLICTGLWSFLEKIFVSSGTKAMNDKEYVDFEKR